MMGYTHYWFGRPEEIGNYEQLCTDLDLIETYCASVGVELTGYDPIIMGYRKGAPLHVGDLIAFNGVPDDDYESFCMPKYRDGDCFNFCKTARKPYDLAVCLALLRMAAIVPGFSFDSDGSLSREPEWRKAKTAYAKIFGAKPTV
jgi:hypothetical protein